MKIIKLLLSILLVILLLIWTYYISDLQANTWQSANAIVSVEMLVRLLFWVKVTAFGLFLLKNINSEYVEHRFNGFKLITVKQRIGSNITDYVCIAILWILLIVVGSLLIAPFYESLISFLYPEGYYRTQDPFNFLFDFGWYIYWFSFLLYNTTLEYYLNSTFGKMISNCGIISGNGSKVTFGAIVLKNILRLIPINEFMIYSKGYSLNEYLSNVRIVCLEDNTLKRYDNLMKYGKYYDDPDQY